MLLPLNTKGWMFLEWTADQPPHSMEINQNIINSILAVIYLTKLQNLINRPVMNCSI